MARLGRGQPVPLISARWWTLLPTLAQTADWEAALGIDDSVDASVSGAASQTQALGMADTLTAVAHGLATRTDAIGIGESLTPLAHRLASVTEALGIGASSATGGLTVDTLHTDGTRMAATSVFNGPGTTGLRVMVPDAPAASQPHRFLYVLPVKPDANTDFGDGFDEVVNDNWHNVFNCTVIAPEFHEEPWMADHPTDPNQQYETFMTQDLRDWVIANLTQTGTEEHVLLSFSKGGLGVLVLIFRHPTLYRQAMAWDVPATKADVQSQVTFQGGWDQIVYGTEANYDANYDLLTHLDDWATPFTSTYRLWLEGESAYETSTATLHTGMVTNAILHGWNALTGTITHRWDTGWLPRAMLGWYQQALLPTHRKPWSSYTFLPTGQRLGMLLAEGTGTTTRVRGPMASTLGANVVLQAGMTWQDGYTNGDPVLRFPDGGTGLHNSATDTSLDGLDRTIIVWCAPHQLTFDDITALVDQSFNAGGASYGGWSFYLSASQRMVWSADPTRLLTDNGPQAISYSSPQMFAVTYNATTKQARFYLNGALNSTQTNAAIVEKASGSAFLMIGDRLSASAAGQFFGDLQQVRIYDYILTAAEIEVLHAHPFAGWAEPHEQALGVADTFTGTAHRQATLSQGLGVAETISAVVHRQASVTEPVGVAETLTGLRHLQAARTEPIGIADTPTALRHLVAARTEPLGVADSTTALTHAVGSRTEPLGVATTESALAHAQATLTQGLGLSTTHDAVTAGGAARTEALGIADTLTALAHAKAAQTEPLGVAEVLTGVAHTQAAQTQPLGMADTSSAVRHVPTALTEGLGIATIHSGLVRAVASVDEPLGTADTRTAIAHAQATLTQALGVSDAPAAIGQSQVFITAALGIGDSFNGVIPPPLITPPLVVFVGPSAPAALVSSLNLLTWEGVAAHAEVVSEARDLIWAGASAPSALESSIDILTYEGVAAHAEVISAARDLVWEAASAPAAMSSTVDILTWEGTAAPATLSSQARPLTWEGDSVPSALASSIDILTWEGTSSHAELTSTARGGG